MHSEQERAVTKKGIYGQIFDDIISGSNPDLNRTVLIFSVGAKDSLTRKALSSAVLAWRALKIKSDTAITMHFGGYDDDPRELWQIPEVRHFVQQFCAKTKAHEHPQVEPQSRNWLLACGADPTLRVTVEMITEQESLAKSAEFFKEMIKPKDKKP
jgi:hypothetical protein